MRKNLPKAAPQRLVPAGPTLREVLGWTWDQVDAVRTAADAQRAANLRHDLIRAGVIRPVGDAS